MAGRLTVNTEHYEAVIADGRHDRWLAFCDPLEIIEVHILKEVRPALEMLERRVEDERLWAVGFLSYEAGPAFDSAIAAHLPDDFPLLRFGLFRQPEVFEALDEPKEVRAIDFEMSESPESYRESIARIRDYIARGDTYQVNYTTRLKGSEPNSTWGMFTRMARAQEAGHSAFVRAGRWTICSASPEVFFQRNGQRVLSRPMKGTAQRGLWSEQDRERKTWLAQSEKNRAENVMIVDMVRNDLGRVAPPGGVRTPHLFDIERYPTVWQMTSTVEARCDVTQTELIGALFPAASITGAPKIRTTQIIRELESTPRRVYTGSIGYLAPGRRARMNVAIRTVLVDHEIGESEYAVGGGIVWDSDPEQEFQECLDKCRVLHYERPEFRLLETMRRTPGEGFFLLDRHLRRLADSAQYFGFDLRLTELQEQLHRKVGTADAPLRVRLTVGRPGDAQIELHTLELRKENVPLRVALAKYPISSDDIFLYHKTTFRDAYEAAKASRPGYDDVLLYNERGEVTETTIGNVVFERDGARWTPPLESGLLDGTLRREMLERGEIKEKLLRVDELSTCKQYFRINSVRNLQEMRLELDAQ